MKNYFRKITTELGVVTHNYWHENGQYFRQVLDRSTSPEVFKGDKWQAVVSQFDQFFRTPNHQLAA